MSNYYENQDLGSVTRAVQSGHGEASENASNGVKRHMARALATEGLNVGPASNAQRSGHSSLAAGSQAHANNVARAGESMARGEQTMGQAQDESSSVQRVSASDNDGVASSMRRELNG